MKPMIPIEQAKIFIDGTFSDPRLSHPEGLAFDKEGNLWCGGERGEIYKINKSGTQIELVANTGGFSLGMAFDSDGHLYVCDNKHQCVFKLDTQTGEYFRFADGGPAGKMKVPNFPVIDEKRSCLYVSDSYSMDEEGPGIWKFNLQTGEGDLWYRAPLHFANGMVLSKDRNTLYVAETFAQRISSIPILDSGEAGEKQIFAKIDALPDGLAMDVNEALYVSCYEPSQLYRITKEGRVELLIHDPEAHTLCHPTNCAFRGTELFTTNLGRWHITRFEVGIQGAKLV